MRWYLLTLACISLFGMYNHCESTKAKQKGAILTAICFYVIGFGLMGAVLYLTP